MSEFSPGRFADSLPAAGAGVGPCPPPPGAGGGAAKAAGGPLRTTVSQPDSSGAHDCVSEWAATARSNTVFVNAAE